MIRSRSDFSFNAPLSPVTHASSVVAAASGSYPRSPKAAPFESKKKKKNFRLSAVPMDTVPAHEEIVFRQKRHAVRKRNSISRAIFFRYSAAPFLLPFDTAAAAAGCCCYCCSHSGRAPLFSLFLAPSSSPFYFSSLFRQPSLLIRQPTGIETQIFSHSRTHPGGTKSNPEKMTSPTALWPKT